MITNVPAPATFRTNIRSNISRIMHLNPTVESDIKLYSNIEISVYNFAIQEATKRNIVKKWDNPIFINLYLDRLRSVYMNLKQEGFVSRIVGGEIDPKRVAFLSHHDMNPARWQQSIEKKMMRDASRYNTNIQASTDMYTCRRCKSKKTTYYEVATRSADEQMTIFITCLNCGKNWKQ
jgi:DNA-directed RNA polymerase subunit M/transcription elongation factor TFIIS